MSTDEITTFRAARPWVPPYDPVAKAGARARLVGESAALAASATSATPTAPAAPVGPVVPVGGRPRARRRLLTVGALTAALAVGITVVQNVEYGGGRVAISPAPSGPQVLGPVANAAEDLADKAAKQAATQPDGRPRPDQWVYLKHVVATSSGGVGGKLFGPPDRRLTVERWRKADGTRSASLEHGRLEIREAEAVERGGSPRSDYPYLLALPDDTEALLAGVYAVVDSEGGGGRPVPAEARAGRAFQIIQVWMRDSALPPKLRAAMFGALAKLPGVRYEGRARDIAGRRGVTLYRIEEGYLRTEIIVDPTTYEYLGFRNITIRNGPVTTDERGEKSQDEKGKILGWGGLLKAAIVDEPGRRP